MDFALTEEQQMVKDQVTRFAETEIKPIAAELGCQDPPDIRRNE